MGILNFLKNILGGVKTTPSKKYKCPNCGAEITLDMDRCPKCGVRIKSMFRRKCPRCGTLNEIDAKKCLKCGYDFEAERVEMKKTYYICPICGYKADYYMTECPSCRTRFV